MHTTVESVLVYGCVTWTLTKTLLKQLDGIYTQILRMILNVEMMKLFGNQLMEIEDGEGHQTTHQESGARNWYTGERDESSYDEPCCLENFYCPEINNPEIRI